MKLLTMEQCKELLEVTVGELGLGRDNVYRDSQAPFILTNYIFMEGSWSIDKREIEECMTSPSQFVRLVKHRHFQALRRLRDKIDSEINRLGETLDGPR